jgi:hypothetical protein
MFALVFEMDGVEIQPYHIIKLYSTQFCANTASELLDSLDKAWCNIEDVEPERRHELYDEYLVEIQAFGLMDVVKLMFDDELGILNKSVVSVPDMIC